MDDVFDIIAGEVLYAQELWDSKPRAVRPLHDAEKPVEFWLMHMRRYIRQAEEACYGTDKTDALDAIRKVAALCVRCMMHNRTPPRKA